MIAIVMGFSDGGISDISKEMSFPFIKIIIWVLVLRRWKKHIPILSPTA